MADLAVTGSTGQVGGRVARRLAAAGVPMRLVVRDPARAPSLPGAEVAQASYADREAAERALAGIRTLFMVSGAESATRLAEHTAFVDAAATAGVAHVVYLSFISAAENSTFTLGRDHWHSERHLEASGMARTFLRDNLYADFLPRMVGGDGVIRGPAGTGRAAVVAQDDVADAVVAVLTAPQDHAGRTYGLTGPEALTLDQVAATITRVTGRPTRYHDETLEEAYASRAAYGAPAWQVEAWVSTYTGIAAGEFAEVTGDVELLTGHPATDLAEVLRRVAERVQQEKSWRAGHTHGGQRARTSGQPTAYPVVSTSSSGTGRGARSSRMDTVCPSPTGAACPE